MDLPNSQHSGDLNTQNTQYIGTGEHEASSSRRKKSGKLSDVEGKLEMSAQFMSWRTPPKRLAFPRNFTIY